MYAVLDGSEGRLRLTTKKLICRYAPAGVVFRGKIPCALLHETPTHFPRVRPIVPFVHCFPRQTTLSCLLPPRAPGFDWWRSNSARIFYPDRATSRGSRKSHAAFLPGGGLGAHRKQRLRGVPSGSTRKLRSTYGVPGMCFVWTRNGELRPLPLIVQAAPELEAKKLECGVRTGLVDLSCCPSLAHQHRWVRVNSFESAAHRP